MFFQDTCARACTGTVLFLQLPLYYESSLMFIIVRSLPLSEHFSIDTKFILSTIWLWSKFKLPLATELCSTISSHTKIRSHMPHPVILQLGGSSVNPHVESDSLILFSHSCNCTINKVVLIRHHSDPCLRLEKLLHNQLQFDSSGVFTS